MATAPRREPGPAEGAASPELPLVMRAAEALLLVANTEQDVLAAASALLAQRPSFRQSHGILLYDAEREELYPAIGGGRLVERPELRTMRVRLGEGAPGTAALFRRVINIPDQSKDPRTVRAVRDVASVLAAPIVAKDGLLGAMVVESPDRAAFDESDEQVLAAFAQLVGLALVQARTHQSRRRDLETIRSQLAEIQALRDVAERAAGLDLPATLQAVTDAIQELATADSTGIWLARPEQDALELAALTFDRRLYPEDYDARLRAVAVRPGTGLLGWVAAHRQPLLLGDVERDSRSVDMPGVPLEAKSAIVVPIVAEERLLGVLRAVKLGAQSFTQEHFRLAHTLADQAALALQTASLHHEQAGRLRILGALYEASLSLSEAATPDEVLNVVLRGAMQVCEAESGFIWRREPDGSFALGAVRNVDAQALAALPPNNPESLSNEMLRGGRPILLDDVHDDPRPSWRPAVLGLHGMLGVPLRSEGIVYATLFVLHSRVGFFRPQHVRHVEVLAAQGAAALARASAFQEARRLAITDELTGCYNARYFATRLEQEIGRGRRYRHPISLLLLDSDSLKMVNDRFGYGEGNRHLIELSNTIRENVRGHDILARFGGDEFLVLQPETELAAAVLTAERIRQAIADRSFEGPKGERIEVTVSVGVSAYPGSAENAEELFRQADRALHVAKRRGKNMVAAAPIEGDKRTATE